MKNKEVKNVLITGGSRGIGASTARYFAKKGYNIIINYLQDDTTANNLKKELQDKYNVSVLLEKYDISKEDEVINMLEKIKKEGKTIDVLINNAGIAIDTTVEDKKVEDFKHIIDVNLIGTYLMCKHVSKIMLENKRGSIVNISSTNAIDSFYPYSMDYDASKAGIISLTHNFAAYLAPLIRVNCIAPGWTKTDALKEMDEDQITEECKHILLKRFAHPDEIAEAIYFAATAKYLNDSIIKIDGGRC